MAPAPRSTARHRVAFASVVAVALTACQGTVASEPEEAPGTASGGSVGRDAGPTSLVTLAFAGDVHFQLHLVRLLKHPAGGLGPIDQALSSADVTMVNLESAVTERGTPDPKELEVPGRRYWYHTSPAALDLLDAAGVDVVTMANNHAADYGNVGLQDTLRAARDAPVAVVGVGTDRRAAFTPFRTTVRGTDIAFLAADGSPREGGSSNWAAAATTPGIAAARTARPRALLAAVRAASRRDDVVVVYMHWGREYRSCPTALQRRTAEALAEAGADVVVGSHAHVLLGTGWSGETYVGYGLGNFAWYHNREPDSGVLQLRIEDGRVVSDDWVPAQIQRWGRPLPLAGRDAEQAVADWRRLRACTGLALRPNEYTASVGPIGSALATRMSTSHRNGCPVDLKDLRLLRMSHIGFDGRRHVGEMVVAARYARDVVRVFERLYDARWPIRRMRLVDTYGGADARSMAADNTSAYNCRRVEGSTRWSAHAYGAAIDLNPVENPYLADGSIAPPAGRRFAGTHRSRGAAARRGVIRSDDLVVRAFAAIGWEWGGSWSEPDFQHFVAESSRPAGRGTPTTR
jgi:poly-gamma-glutamate capsule biosynthesis protein CapA/YwtB (metallophosphatase superfamily)